MTADEGSTDLFNEPTGGPLLMTKAAHTYWMEWLECASAPVRAAMAKHPKAFERMVQEFETMIGDTFGETAFAFAEEVMTPEQLDAHHEGDEEDDQ